jgi:hypothetical protein
MCFYPFEDLKLHIPLKNVNFYLLINNNIWMLKVTIIFLLSDFLFVRVYFDMKRPLGMYGRFGVDDGDESILYHKKFAEFFSKKSREIFSVSEMIRNHINGP